MDHAFKVAPGKKVRLADYDTNANGGMSKEEGQVKLDKLAAELGQIQEELYAAGQHSVLMILQGIDTSGKDGAIRSVLIDVNPQGCRVESFKVPTEEELAHDFANTEAEGERRGHRDDGDAHSRSTTDVGDAG